MNIYHVHDFKESEYEWNETGRRKAKRSYFVQWLIIMPIVLIYIVFATALYIRYDFLTTPGYLLIALAAVILAYGLKLICASFTRKSTAKMSLEEKHDYNLYLYHHKYWKNPTVANQALLNNAVILVKLKKYTQAAQALDAMYIEKCKAKEMKLIYFLKVIIASFEMEKDTIEKEWVRYTGIVDEEGKYPDQETLEGYIQMNDLDSMAACLDRIRLAKKEHPVRILVIVLFLVYTLVFLGLAYGINKEAGYVLRYRFSLNSLMITSTGLMALMIAIVVWWYCHAKLLTEIRTQKIWKIFISTGFLIGWSLLLFGNFIHIFLSLDDKETVIRKENGLTYLEVTWNKGYNSYTEKYVTNNPFVMKRMGMSVNDNTAQENTIQNTPDISVPEDIAPNPGDNAGQENNVQNYTDNEEQSTWDADAYWTKLENGMRAVYEYLSETKALENMEFSYSSNAKGELYAIVGTGQDDRDGKMINFEYGIYYNKEKTDENGVNCDEFVLEKKYKNGSYDTQLIDFYLVNPDTLEVTDEHKTTW